MSIKEFTTDEALLSTPCEKATAEDAAVAQDLLDTLASLEGAACVHANQIGVAKSLFAYLDETTSPTLCTTRQSSSGWFRKRKPRAASPMKSPRLTPATKR